MEYGEKIRYLREINKMTQAEMAKILQKSQQGYSHLENGKARLSIDDLKTICEFYNISADFILGLPPTLKYPR